MKVKGTWKYLYRAMDKEGKTVDFLLRAKRDTFAAYRFFLKAMRSSGVPEKITIDKSGLGWPRSNKAEADAFVEDVSSKDKPIEIRQVKYLNNIALQDHRGVKQRTGPMLMFQVICVCAQDASRHRTRAHVT